MGTSTVRSNMKTASDVGVLTTWTEIIEFEPYGKPASVMVWDNGSNSNQTYIKLQYSHDGSRWCESVNGSFSSNVMSAGYSTCYTSVDIASDLWNPFPHMRLLGKKESSRESMNASAYWGDNR